MELQFREASLEDAETIKNLTESAFQTIDSRPGWSGIIELMAGFEEDLEFLKRRISSPDFIILLASQPSNDTIIASVEVSKKNNMGRISRIAVHDNYQRGGLGKVVLTKAEEYCRGKWGVSMTSINVLSSRKPLREWYERRGYVLTGETAPFPEEGKAGLDLPDLHFIEMIKVF